MTLKRRRQEKEKMAEECCFICKDSGQDLRVCYSRNCLKAYHPGCVQNGDEVFICDWHICVQCRGRSDYQCLCCPLHSVCCACLGKVEFVQLMRKQNKGFCSTCLNLAIAIEKNDPHVAKTDTYEILFKDYWEGIKDAEHLKLVDLEAASDFLNRKLNCKEGEILERFPADDHKSDENKSPDNGANDQTIPFASKGKQIKANTSQKNKSNKRTYAEWCSEELIGFLSSLGKDTSKPLDELEIIGVVKGYIKEKKLYQDDKKVRFLCDDKLQPLFTRTKVRCKMIRKFLAVHLASNAVSEDESFCSFEDDDDAPIIKNRPRNILEPKIAKRVSERSKRHFASLTQNNINLIYLRKTLVVKLLSQPDTFENKVVGCFVRVRCGKKVRSYEIPKKAYLLGQVTGIKKSENEYKINDTCTDTLLRVTGLLDDVSISMLSDEDLAEDECDDLISFAEKGLLKRPTVAELEEKVATVHTDIVNHWIERELKRLERKIDFAHMKGLRIEMVELLDQKKLLKAPAERQHRLDEVPEIVPDTEYKEKETKLQVAASNSSQENRACDACLSGVTPDLAPHYQMDDTQDDSPAQTMDIDQDGSDHFGQAVVPKINVVDEVIDPISDDDEDPRTMHLLTGREEANPGVVCSVFNSDGSEEKHDVEETLSLGTSPKRGTQSSWETKTSEPKKPRLSEESALAPAGVVVPSASCMDIMDMEARLSPRLWPELVAGPSSAQSCLVATQSGPLSACSSSRALVRALDPTHPDPHSELAWLDQLEEVELAAWGRAQDGGRQAESQVLEAEQLLMAARSNLNNDVFALAPRLLASSAAKSAALRELHAAAAEERRRREELSAELASTARALREARSEAQGWSTELADVRRQLGDAQVQRHAVLEDVGRLETARQAAVEESARLVAQLEELRRGKAASDAAAQESARSVEVLKAEKLNLEAARESSERARQDAEAGLIGCKEFIYRLDKQFRSSMERCKLQAEKLERIQQLSADD